MSRISTRKPVPCGQFASKKDAQAFCNTRKEDSGDRWKPVNVGYANPGFDRYGQEREAKPWGVLKV